MGTGGFRFGASISCVTTAAGSHGVQRPAMLLCAIGVHACTTGDLGGCADGKCILGGASKAIIASGTCIPNAGKAVADMVIITNRDLV